MATERSNYEIFVELLGIPEMQAQARAGAEAMAREWSQVFDRDISAGGGNVGAMRNFEARLAGQLSLAQTARQRATNALEQMLEDPKTSKLNDVLNKPMRYTNDGVPYAQDERAKKKAVAAADEEVLNALLKTKDNLLAAQSREQGILGQLTLAQQKRVKAEYDASEEGQQAAAAAKLDNQRRQGQARQVADDAKAREQAEREAIAAAKKEAQEREASAAALERQRARAEAILAEQEFNARRNPLTDPLESYMQHPRDSAGNADPKLVDAVSQFSRTSTALEAAQARIADVYKRAEAGEFSAEQATEKMDAAKARYAAALDAHARSERTLHAASETGQREAAAAQLEAQRRRGLAQQLDQETKAAEKVTREQEATAASLERQRSRAEARLSEQEYNARRNPLTDPLSEYQKPLAEGTHEPERSQVALVKAQSEVEQTLRKIKTIWEASAKGELEEIEAKDKMAAARRQLTAAMQRETVAQERLDAEAGGFIGQFKRGFKGASDRPYAEQLGQAIKFSAFYGAAYRIQFALLQTFRDALTEGIDFEQGLSDMALATGRSKDSLRDLGDSLALISSNAGSSPAAGVQVGARAMGLYGLSASSDHGMQEYVARLSTEVVSKLALGSKVDPITLQQNLAAITQATGLGAAGQLRVADLDAYFSKRFGTAPGETLESGAQSTSVGISAGFSLEQIQAAAALMISRTGQSSSAIGGYLAQIFSRGGEGSLTGVATKYGVETQGRALSDVFADLAKVYKNSGRSVQTEIAAAFGRGKVQNAVVALLQDFQEVGKAAKDANRGGNKGAEGALDRSFTARINNIGGEITLLSGHFKEFARLIGASGLLSGIGLLVEILDKIITTANSFLSAFLELPGPVRTVVGLMLALAAAQRIGIGSAIASRGAYAAEGLSTAAMGAGGGLAGIRAAGAAALGSVGPWVAATAALVAIGKLHDSAVRVRHAIDDTEAAYRNPDQPGVGGDPAAYRNRATELRAQAKKDREATGSLANFLSFGQADNYPNSLADALDAEAKRVDAIAKRVAAQADTEPLSQKTFTSLDEAGLTAGLQAITDAGGNAITRLQKLREAIYGIGDAANNVKLPAHPDELASQFEKDLHGALKGVKLNATPSNDPAQEGTYKDPATVYEARVREQLSGTEVQKRLTAALKERGVSNLTDLTPEMLNDVASEVMKFDFTKKGKGGGLALDKILPKSGQKQLQNILVKAFQQTIQDQIDAFKDVYDGSGKLSVSEGLALANHVTSATADRGAYRSKTDYAGRSQDQRGLIRALKSIQSRVPTEVPQITREVRAAEEALVQVSLDRLDAIRKVALANAGDNQGKKNAANRAYVRNAVREILTKNGTRDQLAAVVESAGKGAMLIARKMIQDAIDFAKIAQQVQAELAQAAAAMAASLPGPFGAVLGVASFVVGKEAGSGPQSMRDLKGLKEQTYLSAPDTSGSGSGADKAKKDEPTAEEVRAARLAAEAARKGGAIAPARAAVAQALAELHKAKKGTVEYWNALASYYQAQDQLNDALRAYRHILGELRIDNTDPVAEAQLALAEARRKLGQDRGKGVDVRAQDRLDIKNAQTQLESEKFNQRLSDVQTAEQLGRISHAAYIRYLDSEHNRLSAISHRTRQQQDELNQIDQLMKDAAGQMQGAFNIGDIKLPTPYEVRRYIKSATVSTPYALGAGATGGTTTIYINGADTGAVRKIINDTVGKGTRVLTTTTRRN